MPTKELSKVNYNGDEYIIVDSTASSKFSPLGHHHTVSELDGDIATYSFASPMSEDANHNVTLTTVPVGKGGTGTTSFTSGEVLIGNGTNAIGTLGIDTTTGGTANSSELITSGAVYDTVNGLSPTGHHHNMSDIDNAVQGVYYVVGTQTTTTGNWTGTLTSVSELYEGLTIAYYLTQTGSGNASLTLTLGSETTSAIPVYYTGTSRMTTHAAKGSVVMLTYADGAWRHMNYVDGNSVPATQVATASTTTAKVGTHTYYALRAGNYTLVTLRYGNTRAGAITLNINSTGAKPIYINGSPSSASNHTLPAGTYIVYYDGTAYYFNTNGMISGPIYDLFETKANKIHTHSVSDITDLAFNSPYNATTNKVATMSDLSAITISGLGLDGVFKFIGFATSTITDGQTATPTISGIPTYTTPVVGDVVVDSNSHYEYVYTSAGKWERLGSDDDYVVKGYTFNYTPTGTIGNTGTVSNYRPSGSISAQTFHGANGEISVTGTASGSITVKTATTGTINYTPAGTLSATFSGTAGTVSVEGSVTALTASAHSYTPAGTITTSTGTVNYTPTGTITINNLPTQLEMTGTASGTITITSTTTTTGANYTPKGTVSGSITGSAATISVEGLTTGVAVGDHTYTPAGTITSTTDTSVAQNYRPTGSVTLNNVPNKIEGSVTASGTVAITTSTGTVNYTPSGTLSGTLTGSTATISVEGSTTGITLNNYTPEGSITVTSAGTANYTPKGTITGTFTGATTTFEGSYKPEGSVTVPTFTTTTTTQNTTLISSWDAGAMFSATISDDLLELSSGAVPSLSWNNNAVIKSVTTTSSTTSVNISGTAKAVTVSGTPKGNITAEFSGTASRFAFSGTAKAPTVKNQGTVTATGAYTPQGTITGSLIGTGVRLVASFTPTSTAVSLNFPALTAGFTGDWARLKFTGSTATIKHTVEQGTVIASGSYTPEGTFSGSLSGTAVKLSGSLSGTATTFTGAFPQLTASFNGNGTRLVFSGTSTTLTHSISAGTVTASGTFTPAGSITGSLIGTGVAIGATFAGNANTFTGSFTPTGTIDAATFTGDWAHLKFNGDTVSISIG